MFDALNIRKKFQPKARKVTVSLDGESEDLGLCYNFKPGAKGPNVAAVIPGGAADRAGIQTNMFILSVDGTQTPDHMALLSALSVVRASRKTSFKIEVLPAKARRVSAGPVDSPCGDFPKALTRPLLEGSSEDRRLYVPRLIEVVCPTQKDIEGTYEWRDAAEHNRMPIWVSDGGRRLYNTKNGLWALVDVNDGPDRNVALVSSCQQARGAMPTEVHWSSWQQWIGDKWVPCPIRMEELRIDPVDGNPYWRGAFTEYYGPGLGSKKWNEAAPDSYLADEEPLFEEYEESEASGTSTRSNSQYEPPSLEMVQMTEG